MSTVIHQRVQATREGRLDTVIARVPSGWVVHAHVFPRYHDEPPELREKPVWFYDWASAPKFERSKYQDLIERIAAWL